MTRPAYEHRHIVSFEETNLTGNVYFVNHLRWQGRCREAFLRERAPGVLDELTRGLRLVTTRCSCEYFTELFAFDEIIVRMRLGGIVQNRVSMLFDYVRLTGGKEDLIARGEQEVACLRAENGKTTPAPVPTELVDALRPYGATT
jgi:enediyne biosynthesis thioesterase